MGKVTRKKLPSPYQRNSISLSTPPDQRRYWREVRVETLAAGDTLPGLGTVSDITIYPGMVWVFGGDRDHGQVHDMGAVVRAFTQAPEVQ